MPTLSRVSLGLMMMMMMMMLCKRLAQVPMLCAPIYDMKKATMPKTPICTTFSAHTKMTAKKRGQDEVFGRNYIGKFGSKVLSQ